MVYVGSGDVYDDDDDDDKKRLIENHKVTSRSNYYKPHTKLLSDLFS